MILAPFIGPEAGRGGDSVGKQSVVASENSLSSMHWLHREEWRGRPGLGGEEAARETLDLVRRWWSEGVAAHGCGRWRRRFRLPLAGGGR
jgi:hypothetical protein